MGGCTNGGGGAGGGTSPPSTSSTTTGSPATASGSSTSVGTSPSTTTAAEVPSAARQHTPAGAEAFVRFFVDRINAAYLTADPTPIRVISERGCLSCRSLEKDVSSLAAKGQRYSSAALTFTSDIAIGGAPKGQQHVRLFMTQNRVNIIDGNGQVVRTDREKPLKSTVGLIWQGGQWLVYDMAD